MKKISEGKPSHQYNVTNLDITNDQNTKIIFSKPIPVTDYEVWMVEAEDCKDRSCEWAPGTIVITLGRRE